MCTNFFWNVLSSNSSTIIALCALLLTVWQAFVTRKHNKLSVKPYLTTWSNVVSNKGFYQVEILNNGIGPALIKTFQVFVNGNKIVGQESELMDKAIRMLFSNHHYDAYNSFLSKGYMMSANDKHALIRIQFLEPTIPKFEDVELASKKLRIVIEYESIYNQTQMYDSDNYRILN